uniref:Uncharacterized protein n=1 Tax=Clytia hemisphaerica TaxID=252671 RepID=A0A7M5VF48_9CNID
MSQEHVFEIVTLIDQSPLTLHVTTTQSTSTQPLQGLTVTQSLQESTSTQLLHVSTPTQSTHVSTPTQSTHVSTPTQSTHVSISTQSTHVSTPTQSTHVSTPTQSTHVSISTHQSPHISTSTQLPHISTSTQLPHISTSQIFTSPLNTTSTASTSIPTRILCNAIPVKPRRSRLNPAIQNAKIKAPESVVVYNKDGEEVSIVARKKEGAVHRGEKFADVLKDRTDARRTYTNSFISKLIQYKKRTSDDGLVVLHDKDREEKYFYTTDKDNLTYDLN